MRLFHLVETFLASVASQQVANKVASNRLLLPAPLIHTNQVKVINPSRPRIFADRTLVILIVTLPHAYQSLNHQKQIAQAHY